MFATCPNSIANMQNNVMVKLGSTSAQTNKQRRGNGGEKMMVQTFEIDHIYVLVHSAENRNKITTTTTTTKTTTENECVK